MHVCNLVFQPRSRTSLKVSEDKVGHRKKYLDLRQRKQHYDGETFTVRSAMICNFNQILLRLSN